jgi:hypothetical protein
MAYSAQALFNRLAPITSGCPPWLYLERRGIPAEVIKAHQDELRYLSADILNRPRGEHALAARSAMVPPAPSSPTSSASVIHRAVRSLGPNSTTEGDAAPP